MRMFALLAMLVCILTVPVEAGRGKVKSKCKKNGACVSKVRHHRHVAKSGLSACASHASCYSHSACACGSACACATACPSGGCPAH